MPAKGLLFVMAGASGVGKGTIRQAALADMSHIHYSISATTRAKREGEVHGKHYYFYDQASFKKLLAEDALLEHAEYVGDYYGTPAAPIQKLRNAGEDVLLEIDLAGARNIKAKCPEAIMIFIVPPSLLELERRLRGRGSDSEEKIQKRLARAKEELKALEEFDYVIINDMLADAVDNFQSIIKAERARVKNLSEKDIISFKREL